MKSLELQNFGVTEMNTEEMREVDGGWWPIIRGIITACRVVSYLSSGNTEIHGDELRDNTYVAPKLISTAH